MGRGLHGDGGPDLRTVVSRFPTPTASEANRGAAPSEADRRTPCLSAVAKWPTPQARDYRGGMPERVDDPGRHNDLNDAVAKWPSPQANRTGGADSHGVMPEEFRAGMLNPDWVEWLMGVPIGWTDADVRCLRTFEDWQDGADWWTTEPDIPRVTTHRANRVNRIRSLGNGIVPASLALFLEHLNATN